MYVEKSERIIKSKNYEKDSYIIMLHCFVLPPAECARKRSSVSRINLPASLR